MKHLDKLMLILVAVTFLISCSENEDLNKTATTASSKSNVIMKISPAAADSFAAAGITNLTVYAYIKESKKDSLIKDTTLAIGEGRFAIGLPLGEKIQSFIVANGTIINQDSLSTAALSLDPSGDKEPWLSNIASFTTDKTVSNVTFTMQRMVGQAVFQPEEDAQTLQDYTQFNNIDITFTNIATYYKINGDSTGFQDVTINAGRAEHYTGRIYSLPTTTAPTTTGLKLIFKKDQTAVNSTPATLDAGIRFAPSHRYNIFIPVTDEGYITTPWTRSSKGHTLAFKLTDTKY